MIGERMEEALNQQINKELYSSYLYLSMAAYCENEGLPGFANWFMVQYREENDHAMKIYNYINERGGRVKLEAIDKPDLKFKSPLDLFRKTLEHEKFITDSINQLVEIAEKEKDRATEVFLQWFVEEQVEEEANDNEIIDKLEMVGEKGNGLYSIDRELAGRVYSSELEED